MIDTGLYVSFVLVAAAIIVMPGPNVLLTIAISLTQGHRRGMQTVAGSLAAMTIQLGIAAAGTAFVAEVLAEAFQVLKWAGIAYLLYLGLVRIRAAVAANDTSESHPGTATGSFTRGFFVGITNPKTILFFGAFLPQFVSEALPLTPQFFVLSATFLIMVLFFDSLYVLAASKAGELARAPLVRRWLDGCAGTLLVGSGIGLAVARKT